MQSELLQNLPGVESWAHRRRDRFVELSLADHRGSSPETSAKLFCQTGKHRFACKYGTGAVRQGVVDHASSVETPDEFARNFAASQIENAIQRLRERIDLIGIATCRKGHDLTTEFIKPACPSW